MRLIRYGEPGQEKPGILDTEGRVRDLSATLDDLGAASLGRDALERLKGVDVAGLPLVAEGTRLGPCVANVGNFVAVGLNYSDHAAETGAAIPAEPILFNKAPSCIIGPNDDVVIPRGSTKLDWEVELALVIGETCSYVSEEEALSYVAGACLCNDVSERAFQNERGGTWTKGKGCPTFGPLGPWLVTLDEIDDLQDLDMWLDVNGNRRQTGNTSTMIFNCAFLVHYISQFMILRPGDVITTGTPPGVGLGMKPQTFLKEGDRMSLGIKGLGTQEQTVRA
ncbi:2-keto-4-pentenoate hydratase/2-oxohepta-3-ene-1,7-dioic acid hydratase in catechol pathway [Rhodobium orientis]|uniref:2-hydroxyhepta-2,4-diene-1,7-dioate isomerase n=1 Tax=Rhodobium orientis TaxID=34017 RepID=A0A327JQD6_9HYPH|nr:fumarylacetoacetate hydrolase family protein [Rhodobium orientis]MBB4301379.1 2-keto-4-pentenoate hydratase/2-oxohepta-3-ene-1,7-dioic acid hydratase in catechol pathway [Rhodobium orientis]MBK5951034.1 2-hydroxyhepta-2,4-diene-1,7-dioate isomerase [Rhodobium orientis]RAI27604.1 2-hydroxyhepta-2,4-diene-1,7-dioate isomerase [Rhodobium orientis]